MKQKTEHRNHSRAAELFPHFSLGESTRFATNKLLNQVLVETLQGGANFWALKQLYLFILFISLRHVQHEQEKD